MATDAFSNTIYGYVRYDTEHLLTTADLLWPTQQPKHTYTIDVTDHLSIELDTHLPVRPSRVRTYNSQDLEQVSGFFGAGLAEVMADAPRTKGLGVIALRLGRVERKAIAELQIESSSTPPLIKDICLKIAQRVTRSQQLPPDSTIRQLHISGDAAS